MCAFWMRRPLLAKQHDAACFLAIDDKTNNLYLAVRRVFAGSRCDNVIQAKVTAAAVLSIAALNTPCGSANTKPSGAAQRSRWCSVKIDRSAGDRAKACTDVQSALNRKISSTGRVDSAEVTTAHRLEAGSRPPVIGQLSSESVASDLPLELKTKARGYAAPHGGVPLFSAASCDGSRTASAAVLSA